MVNLGSAKVGVTGYITNLDVDPTGKYLYYMPGADGYSAQDGTPVVQYNIQSGSKKILAFLEPFYNDTHDFMMASSFGAALDPSGDKLYITWHGNNDGQMIWYRACGMTVLHLPEMALQPGDTTGDGFVGADDLVVILSNWGKVGAVRLQGDLNGDGFVGADDYVEVLTYWGVSPPPEPLPEPASMSLIIIGSLALLRGGR